MTEDQYARWLRHQNGTPQARRASTMPAPTEQQEQEIVVRWARAMRDVYPQLVWLFHVPNGGARDIATATMLQRAGVVPGVPDMFLPVPMNGRHGLWLELKRADRSNSTSAAQKIWLDYLRSAGYEAVVCYGADEAIAAVERYLNERIAIDGDG